MLLKEGSDTAEPIFEAAEFPAKMVKTPDASGDLLPKQIGCMNGIFQLFDRRLLFVGRQHHKRLLAVAGAQQKLEPQNATKAVTEKDPELQKGSIRESLESSQAASSYASSSHSSTQAPLGSTAMKGWKHSLNRGMQSPDIRDVVRDSMYREAHGVHIKSFTNDGRVSVMKHIDSPRLRVALPRFSYDGRESRDTLKMSMKLKELPRFSLDSKASSMKQHLAIGCDLHMENENSNRVPPVKTECGSHSRSSSIVTKLMGLEDFADSITTDESSIARTRSRSSPRPRVALLSKSPTTAARSPTKQVSSPKSVVQKNRASQSPRQSKTISVRKTTLCSKLPLEPAPWKKQDYSQHCQKTASQSGRNPCSSVYGQIEKRITKLEFKRSGKDLRALKQILEAMQKTREKLEIQRRESVELKLQEITFKDSCSNQNSSSFRKTYQQPVLTTKETCCPKQLSSPTGITKSGKVTGKVKISSSSQVPRTQISKYDRERAHYRTPMDNNKKDPNQRFPSNDKKITRRKIESEHSAAQCIRVESCTTSGRSHGVASPRMQHSVLKTERESPPNNSTSETDRARMQFSKKVRQKCPQDGKHRVTSMDLQLSNGQLSNLSSERQYASYTGDTASTKSESNNSSVASHADTHAMTSVNFFSLNNRKQDYATTPKQHMSAAELTVITMEQPSPISVLDTPFYSEGSPSPVKKISTAFQDEGSSHDEAEWNLQNLNHLAASTDSSYKSNQKSENLLDLIQNINPGHRYITKMLLAFGLLKDMSIIQTDKDNRHISMDDIFNSNMFHALQEEDAPIKDANEQLIENTDHSLEFNQKIQRKVVTDVANEILIRKITSGRLFTMGRGRMTLQGILKEVYLEIEDLCRTPYRNVQDEDDKSSSVLTVDMKYQSDDWTDYSGEVPALVLDIERLIFKDLINEVITSEVSGPGLA